ncbi:MAG: zinc ribbon domain-containing protein [Planctomycetota bacterium]|nr:zinc ribbon domain-containing protein [Planctomycetota bacterium]
MPIKVACQCGASFAAKDELAGKAVRCPKCKQPLKIPVPAAAPAQAPPGGLDDLFDEVGIAAKKGPSCPKCHAELKPNAIMCVACGVDLQSGEHREGVKIQDMSRGGHGEAADSLLDRAARQIEIDKVEDKKNLTHGAPAYVYIFGLGVIVAFASLMMALKDNRGLAFWITGLSIIVFGDLIAAYYGIRIIIVAFMESVGQGFLYLLVPFYALYYIITRWDRTGKFFMQNLRALGLCLFGLFLMWIGSLIKPEDKRKSESIDGQKTGVQVVERVTNEGPPLNQDAMF